VSRLPAAAAGQVQTLERALRGVVRQLRRLAAVTVAAVIAIGVLLGRDGFEAADALLVAILLAAPGVVLFFAQGLVALASVPDRVRRLPGEGQERASELAQLGGQLRGARLRRLPLVLWRLRGAVGSARDLAGIALPLRVLTPGFLALAAGAALACLVLVVVGVIGLLVLAAG
jgi:hypothetical protein